MTTPTTEDFLTEATQEQLTAIGVLIQEQLRLEGLIEDKEQELKACKQQLAKIQQGLLPDALFAAGLSEFKTLSGDKVLIRDDLSVSVPKDKKESIVKWLDEHGHGDIVTGKVYVDLPRGSEAERASAIDALLSVGLEPSEDTTVNTATLKSILKQHLAQGESLDLTEFGAFAWKKAEIKRA